MHVTYFAKIFIRVCVVLRAVPDAKQSRAGALDLQRQALCFPGTYAQSAATDHQTRGGRIAAISTSKGESNDRACAEGSMSISNSGPQRMSAGIFAPHRSTRRPGRLADAGPNEGEAQREPALTLGAGTGKRAAAER